MSFSFPKKDHFCSAFGSREALLNMAFGFSLGVNAGVTAPNSENQHQGMITLGQLGATPEIYVRRASVYRPTKDSLAAPPSSSESGRVLFSKNMDFYHLPFLLSEGSGYEDLSPKSSLYLLGGFLSLPHPPST